MSLQQKAVSSVFWSTIQTFGNQVIGFIVSLILARLLMPAEMGLIGMIAIFMGVGTTLINGGLTTSLIRTSDPDQADYSTVFIFNLAGSILIYLLMFFLAPWVAEFYGEAKLTEITRLYCLIFIIGALSAVQTTRLHKSLDFKTETKASLVSSLLSAVVGISMAYAGFGVMSLVWMALVAAGVNTLMLWFTSGWKPSLVFSKEKFRTHFAFGNKMMFSGLLEIFYQNIYNILIGRFYNAAQLGFYNRADSLKGMPVGILGGILGKVTFPLFAEVKEDNIRLKNVYKQVMAMVLFVIAPILMTMAVLGEPLFRFLFTEKWLPAVPYFQILCLAGVLYPLHMYNLNILMVKGKSDLFLKLEIAKKVLLTLVIAVSGFYGIYGLLWGQVFTSVLSYFINSYFSGELIDYPVQEQLRDVSPVFVLATVMGVAVYAIDYMLALSHLPDLTRLITGGLTGAFLYLVAARLIKISSLRTLFGIALRNPRLMVALNNNYVQRFINF